MANSRAVAIILICIAAAPSVCCRNAGKAASVVVTGTPRPDGTPETAGVHLLSGRWLRPGRRVVVTDKGKALEGSVVAAGNYSDAANHKSFFGQLRVETASEGLDGTQAFAAGYLEGYLTAARISQHYTNMESWWNQKGHEVLSNVTDWLKEQDRFAQLLATEGLGGGDGTAQRLNIVLRQLHGLAAGYSEAVAHGEGLLRPLTYAQLHLLNSVGDLIDLFNKASSPIPWASMEPHEILATISSAGHCSALIRVTGDLKDILMAHSSWFIYSSMLRIYKHYTLRVAAGHMTSASFSSYPGVLSSLDDFYMHDTGLVLLQTTNSIFNAELYRHTAPQSLLAWQRVRMANMAASGAEWGEVLAKHNSGTYNNQYMVVDLNRFVRGKALLNGLLTVVEQIPGDDGVIAEDMTDVLLMGYWPSFNVPFFHSIYNRSGYPDTLNGISRLGPDFAKAAEGLSYQAAPRGKIFRRDAGQVTDINSLKRIMRYNGFPDDPLSGGSPFGAICSRGDLASKSPSPVGCYDTKVTDLDMAWRLEAEVVNGPTTQDGLPPFSWDRFPGSTHEGMPSVWDFEFELQSPMISVDGLDETLSEEHRLEVEQCS